MQWLDRVKFGSGKNGSPAVSGTINTYAACTGTATQTSLTTTLSASAGDVILIHQSQGTGAGQWEINAVLADAGATLTLAYPLAYTYGTGAQCVLVPQYTGGTISGAVTGTAWNGSIGGIIALMSNGGLTVSGSITATSLGFRGGTGTDTSSQVGWQAEGHTGAASGSRSAAKNGSGGGGGDYNSGSNPHPGGGGGGGNGASGYSSVNVGGTAKPGVGGDATGSAQLTTSLFGGGGGKGSFRWTGGSGGNGGAGGGCIFIFSKNITVSGSIVSTGGAGGNVTYTPNTDDTLGVGGGGSGAGGSILIKTQEAILDTNKVTASAGTAGTGLWDNGAMNGGTGGVGRIHIDYADTYSGTTTPAINATQVTSLKSQVYSSMI